MKIYMIKLVFKTPSQQGILLDLRKKREDILYALIAFNKQFRKLKELKLLEIAESSIAMVLKISKTEPVTAREITYFSKRLHHDRNWKTYSRDQTKLFTAVEFRDVTDEYSEIYNSLPEAAQDQGIPMDESLLNLENESVIISDEDCLKALHALINLKDIGSRETVDMRQKTLIKIKKLLMQALD